MRAQATQAGLVDELVKSGAHSDNKDLQIGRSLFQLLVPAEIEPLMASASAIVLQLDAHTARYPWEMLDLGIGTEAEALGDPHPAAAQAAHRDLPRRAGGRAPRRCGAGHRRAAVRPAQVRRTAGARAEAETVAATLGVQPLLGPDALTAVNALLAGPLRIVHIAGHGEHRKDGSGGVVLSGDAVLGPCEIGAMRHVPELVFVNCCHIGQIHPDPAVPRNTLGALRSEFAASVAEQLIRNGVRCVVAAGWAVEDGAAMQFATRFYASLRAGDRFLDAVGAARRAAWAARPQGNTWAAYQCYGDPDWRLRAADAEPEDEVPRTPDIASAPALALVLENEALWSRHADTPAQRKQRLKALRALHARYDGVWGGIGAVAEAFALAFAECGDDDAAIDGYTRALGAGDGSASLQAAEQLGNLLARRGARRGARDDIVDAIRRLQQLAELQPTAERMNLLGSACKRLAMVESGAAALKALDQAAAHYAQAETLAAAAGADDLFYPVLNGIAAALRRAVLGGTPTAALDAARVAVARASLQAKAADAPDFWSLAALVELQMLEALAAHALAAARAGIERGFDELGLRVAPGRQWESVYDQACFVLQPYADAAGGAEAAAAAALLKRLRKLSGVT